MNNQPTPPKRGQPLKSKEGKRRQLRINFSPPNYEFVTNMDGNPHDFLNNLLDGVRAQSETIKNLEQ